ncbi:CinsV13_orph1 protein [Chelonus insularis]|nr:CinsV13_orph1 protein [Chelonus insularis]
MRNCSKCVLSQIYFESFNNCKHSITIAYLTIYKQYLLFINNAYQQILSQQI